MLNGILTALLVFSVVTAAFTGRMEALSAAALSGCGEAVSLVIALTGMLCLWSGLMEIARRCRLTEALARLLHPLTRWLFPTVPQGSPAMQAICMNLSANLLGLGSLMAFPGSMFGALLCGLVYAKTKNLIATLVGEVFGTSILGGLCAYPVAICLMGKSAGDIAFYAYIVPFLISTAVGAVIAGVLVYSLQRSGALHSMQKSLS